MEKNMALLIIDVQVAMFSSLSNTSGMQTEFCVDTTCRRAFSMGYDNTLVMDAHSTFDGPVLSAIQIIQHHNNILGGRFVKLKSTKEIEFQDM